MGTQDQVIAALSRPETYGSHDPVARVETHISVVFLVGQRAYKLKKAVRFPYLDYSTVEARRGFCEAEVATNRRAAPMLYLGVAPVVQDGAGVLRLGAVDAGPAGSETAVDWLTVMARFDQDGLFDRLAQRGALTPALLDALGEEIAAFHEEAPTTVRWGGADGIAAVIDECAAELGRHVPEKFPAAQVAVLIDACRAAQARVAGLLDARRADGRVRHVHGDMHLRNICLVDGRPVLFDAIEFSPSISHVDVLYDLAFLLMDLLHRDMKEGANRVLNQVLGRTGDYRGLQALPLFLALRALIRAHVGAAAADAMRAEGDGAAADAHVAESASYLALAAAVLAPSPPVLVAVGGLSGSGKTTVARALAPDLGRSPGAVVLRSDVIRKRLAGVGPLERLAERHYGRDMTERVYRTIAAHADDALAAGWAVVADAVYAQAQERRAIEQLGRARGVSFFGFWLDAPAATLVARVGSRKGDASDATADVVRAQLGRDPGAIAWARIDAGGTADRAIAACRGQLPVDFAGKA